MSIYPNVHQEDLINLRKLSDQQKNQRALKIKKGILKQTHDVKIAESLSPITKKLVEVKESTQKLGDVIKENNTSQLAIENIHKALPIGNEKIHPGVIYDTSLENTLNNMKNITGFFNIEKKDNSDIIWNGFPVEKMGGNKLKNSDNFYNIKKYIFPGIQQVLTDSFNVPVKKLNDEDRGIFIDISGSLDFEN